MATGTATLNFGAIGSASNQASVVVTGLATIGAASLVEAWQRLEATAEHSVDEIMYDRLQIIAGNISVGTGFTIYGIMPIGMAYGNYKIDWAEKD